ncbi:MAG: glutamine synthetase beta-grasp domain-containing protein [Anaeroplasma sp.]|nr:glutamine synthetase beta-grasp domain-containing protein [Anaeroplasma sp.]
MGYTKKNILEYVKEDDVKFIRIAFVDPFGNQKNISIMPNELENAFDNGIMIDGKYIFKDNASKLLLVPDPNTISVLPWRPSQGRVVRMFSKILNKDHSFFACDTRSFLIKALESMKNDLFFQTKYDFYLLKTNEEGNPTKIPYDNASFMDIAPDDKGENVRREICLSLIEMDIKPVASHHESGPGQNRIFCQKDNPLKAADDAITFKSVVKTIASRNGLYADFLVKPIRNEVENRCYIEISGKNLNYEYKNLLNHYNEIELFLNPTKELYGDNEKIMLEDDSIIIEVTSLMNPYIAFGLIIYAMQDESLGDLNKNLCFEDALNKAKNSEFVKKYLPKELFDFYMSI